ncbi:MAG: hypothetical protein ACK559_40300, partial [bacterium]
QLDAGGQREGRRGAQVAVELHGELGDGDRGAHARPAAHAGIGPGLAHEGHSGPRQRVRGRAARGSADDLHLLVLRLVPEPDELEAVEQGLRQLSRGHELGGVLRRDHPEARGRAHLAQVGHQDHALVERGQQ